MNALKMEKKSEKKVKKMGYILDGGLNYGVAVPLVNVFLFLVDNSETFENVDNVVDTTTFDA